MTDNEIIKALECCSTATCFTNKCPYEKIYDTPKCTTKLTQDALNLINRQKAEIERLNNTIYTFEKHFEFVKAEAVRKFAEKMNKEAEKVEIDREGDFVETDNKIYDTVANWCKATSDNILKETVDKNND